MGSNASIFRNRYGTDMLTLVIDANNLQPYFPRYVKGSTIKKVPRSPGIMAFSELQTCTWFQEINDLKKSTKIVLVEGKLCKRQSKSIFDVVAVRPELFKSRHRKIRRDVPIGTIFFDYVKVLE